MKFSVYQSSKQGGRPRNEDRLGYSYTRESGIFVLADGMGGHPEGAMAAQLALQTFSTYFKKAANPVVLELPAFLSRAVMAAHHQIQRYAAEKGMLDTPRTTLVAALMEDGQLQWVHCGDSRLYIVRDGMLLFRTRDHSCLEQQANLGQDTRQTNRNILFTCLGSPAKPLFELSQPLPLKHNDRILLCSDGLWGNLSDETITAALASDPMDSALESLIELALKQGGPRCDNVSVLAVRWETENSKIRKLTDVPETPYFASTIQTGELDPTAEDLDDEAIERSIAEINEAIRRSTLRHS